LAADLGANPLTVAKAYQTLLEAGFVRARRGIGFVVADGGTSRLRQSERVKFTSAEWPAIRAEMELLELDTEALVTRALEDRRLRAPGVRHPK
jgi:GntR family transcriptional regulator